MAQPFDPSSPVFKPLQLIDYLITILNLPTMRHHEYQLNQLLDVDEATTTHIFSHFENIYWEINFNSILHTKPGALTLEILVFEEELEFGQYENLSSLASDWNETVQKGVYLEYYPNLFSIAQPECSIKPWSDKPLIDKLSPLMDKERDIVRFTIELRRYLGSYTGIPHLEVANFDELGLIVEYRSYVGMLQKYRSCAF